MNTQITVVDQALVLVPYIHPRLAAPSDNTPGESGADGTNCGKDGRKTSLGVIMEMKA